MGFIARREYGISPQTKRAISYLVFLLVWSGIFLVSAELFVPSPRKTNIPGFITIYSLVVLGIFTLKGWRLRVDGDGIAHRLLFGWDLWTRADLASGRIRKVGSHMLCDPNRSLWSRYLCLDFLAPEDRLEVLNEFNKDYRLPPPPPVPEKLELRYAFRRSAAFEQSVIRLKHDRVVLEFTWEDVQNIHICRLDPLRRDFRSLVIALPGEEVELKYGKDSFAWKGADAETISEFFMHCPARDRVVLSSATDHKIRILDAERDVAMQQRELRKLDVVFLFFLLASAALFLAFVFQIGIVKSLILFSLYAVALGPLVYFVRRLLWKKLNESIKHLALLKSEPRPSV